MLEVTLLDLPQYLFEVVVFKRLAEKGLLFIMNSGVKGTEKAPKHKSLSNTFNNQTKS